MSASGQVVVQVSGQQAGEPGHLVAECLVTTALSALGSRVGADGIHSIRDLVVKFYNAVSIGCFWTPLP